MAVNPYELQRKRVAQESQATSSQENEALKRRFARMGGLQSGSYIKAQERLSGMQEQNKQKALESVDVQESLAQEQKDEAERGRQFARGERLGSQEFASGESALARRFATQEREGSQQFQLGYLGKQQDFTRGEREASQAFASKERGEAQDYAATQAELGRRFTAAESQATRNLQSSQFDKQFAADQEVNKFNQIIASIQANQSSENIRQWYQALFQGGDTVSPLAYQFNVGAKPSTGGYSAPKPVKESRKDWGK